MPILTAEANLFPADLFENELLLADPERRWWVLYTRSRMEKELMRRLLAMEIPFYGPTIEKRTRSPRGRMQKSYLPLFPNYVFMLGTAAERYAALTTNCLSRDLPVADGQELEGDLRQLHRLIQSGMPLTPERCLTTGARVRVRTGPLAGQEGTVLQRRGESHLLVAVRFLQQGASVQLDECDLEPLP
jgi:Transcription termination factor nusG